MEPFNDQPEAVHHEIPAEEQAPVDWVPDLAERLRTIERANLALERARELLERVDRIESERTGTPGD